MKLRQNISLRQTNQYSNLILDYLDKDSFFNDLIRDFPSYQSLKKYSETRTMSRSQRELTLNSILERYASYGLQLPNNINSFLDDDVFTITTGHQLNILTGPLYSILKIASVIKLCQELKKDGLKVLPVFWLASEDHDFDEISKTQVYNQELIWEADSGGPVGRIQPQGLTNVLNTLREILGERFDQALIDNIESLYQAETLAEAHFKLIHLLFSSHDLIIIDADDRGLKSVFVPSMRKELELGLVRKSIASSNALLEEKYKVQAHAREINLFLMSDTERSRIIFNSVGFATSNSEHNWTKEELFELLEEHPENFSPNVLMRPMYQESVLPNLAYVGGGGELAYWLQLKSVFDAFELPFPILVLRKSAGILSAKDFSKLDKLQLELSDLFEEKHHMELKLIERDGAEFDIDQEKESFVKGFDTIKAKVEVIDKSLAPSVEGELKKLEKSLDHIISKVIRAQKRNMEVSINQANSLRDKLLPDNKLQERQANFLQFYQVDFISNLIEACDPIHGDFAVLEA